MVYKVGDVVKVDTNRIGYVGLMSLGMVEHVTGERLDVRTWYEKEDDQAFVIRMSPKSILVSKFNFNQRGGEKDVE